MIGTYTRLLYSKVWNKMTFTRINADGTKTKYEDNNNKIIMDTKSRENKLKIKEKIL